MVTIIPKTEELNDWNFPIKIFKKVLAPYYVTSLILTIILILIFEILGNNVRAFNWGYNKFDSIAQSLLIGLMLSGIQFFSNKIQGTFKEFGTLLDDKNLGSGLRNQIQINLAGSKMFYLVVIFVVLPFLIIQFRAFSKEGNDIFFYGLERSYLAFVLDIYINLLNYISYYLLAIVLWMIFNISWAIDKIDSAIYKNNLKINLFKADRMGGLRPIKNLVSTFSIYYFMLIILFIMSWTTPRHNFKLGYYGYQVLPFESRFLIIFWLIGVAFFLMSWHTIRKILLGKIEDEINHISDLCQYKTQQLSDLVSKEDSAETEKHLSQISNALDALHKERERMLALDVRPMSIKTFFFFLGSAIPSLISIVATLESASETELGRLMINYTIELVGSLPWLS